MNDRQNPNGQGNPNGGASHGGNQGNSNQWNNQWSSEPQGQGSQNQQPNQQWPQQGQQPQQPGQQPGQQQYPQYQQQYPQQGQPPQYQQQPQQPGQQQYQQGQQQQQQWQPDNAASTATPPSTETKKKSPALKIGALLAALVLAIAGGIYVVTQTGVGQKLAEMSYIAAADPGPEAFMDSVAKDDAAEIAQNADYSSGSLAGGVEGGEDNVYGGTGVLSTCDAAALISNLEGNDELNAAFAQGIGINAGDVERYVRSLSPLVLMQDTWVTNHGFKDGRANPFQAVLQRGTAVLVDAYGVPRVRCACGNPLTEAWTGYTAPAVETAAWDDYDAAKVVAIYTEGEFLETHDKLKIRDLKENRDKDFYLNGAPLGILNQVTGDTPMTVPADMGVKPDVELLESLGMEPAEDGSERPTGGERFKTDSGTFAPDKSAPAAGDAAPEEATEEEEAEEPEPEPIDVEALKPQIANMTVTDAETGASVSLTDGNSGGDLFMGSPGTVTYVGDTPSSATTFDPSTIAAEAADLDGDGKEEVIVQVNTWCKCTSPALSKMLILDGDLNIIGDVLLDDALDQVNLPVTRTMLYEWDVDGSTITVKYYARTDSDPLRYPSQVMEIPFEWTGGDSFTLAGEATYYPNPEM